MQRIGVRAYMRSTYDRRGGNEAADASHFLYQLADDRNVTLDVEGKGILCFARYNHWHGSPWHYVVDGTDHVVQETSTANPDKPTENSPFIPSELFHEPLAFTWSTTKGADLSWVPIPFERSFRMAYSRTHYGTGYYIYHLYDRSAPLSQPIRNWDWKTPPDKNVLDIIARAGTDIVPKTTDRNLLSGRSAVQGELLLRRVHFLQECAFLSAPQGFFSGLSANAESASGFFCHKPARCRLSARNRPTATTLGRTSPAGAVAGILRGALGRVSRSGRFRSRAWDPRRRTVRG